jgi:hypothetical protein
MFYCDFGKAFTKAVIISLLVVAIFSGCSKDKEAKKNEIAPLPGEAVGLLSLVSVDVSGWQGEDTELMSEAKDMVKYMNNEAELYSAYGLKRLAAKKYKNEKSHPMLVEIYEFDSSENAYGIYSFDTVGDKLDMGQDSVYGHGLLKFWKGNMLVRVLAKEEYKDLEEDILAFGRQVDSKITTTGSKPKLLSLMLEENLVPDSLHFFHKNICLNNICYIPESVELGLSQQTDAVTAEYALGGKQPVRLLLVKYPDELTAKTAFESFSKAYFNDEFISADRPINMVKMGEEDYTAIALNRKLIILVFEAQSENICKKMVAAVLVKVDMYGAEIGL